MPESRVTGYIGVDVLNNATVCNEAVGLIGAGIPLDIVSVYRFDRPTYYQQSSLADLGDRVHALYPLSWMATAWALFCAPWVFGIHFWTTLAKMIASPAEGWRQRARLAGHFIPAVCLAMYWRKKRIGHIHAHWAHTATTIAMHAAGLLGIGFSFTGHANDLFVHRVALVAKLRRARFVVCISEFHRRFYLALGADPSRLQVVYCGIDTDRFQPRENLSDAIAWRRPRILGVGRLVEKKGFHHLIAACATLRDRGLNCECVIAGSGPEEVSLRQLVNRLDLADRVTITGRAVLQEDLESLLQSAAVFALPCVKDRDGDMDGLPQVLIEAMACGVPSVSTVLVGIPDLIRDGWNGLLVPAEEVLPLADALEQLIINPEWATSLGTRGMEWARLHFDRSEAIRRLREHFLWAAATPGNNPPEHLWQSAPEIDAEDSFSVLELPECSSNIQLTTAIV
jgi:glycosyltransferase involved in cell wall biosynthesis